MSIFISVGRPAAAALAALVTLLLGLAVELAARCKDRRPLAATNKCLARSNKPRHASGTTKDTKGHRRSSELNVNTQMQRINEFHDEREYVVDRRHLKAVRVLRRYSQIEDSTAATRERNGPKADG